jgi:hypothetical protein
MLYKLQKLYPVFAFACVFHGLAFSASVWCAIAFRVVTPNSNMPLPVFERLCYILPLTWPVWAIPLWRYREGRNSRVIVPLILGFVAMLPGLSIWYAMAHFTGG